MTSKIIKILIAVVFTTLSIVSLVSFAGITNDLINRETARREQVVKKVLKQKNNFVKYKEESVRNVQAYRDAITSLREKKSNGFIKRVVKKTPQAMIFVSLSMSDLSLKQIIQDADRYQIPIVIRGLYENSLTKTFEKIFDLVKEKNRGGILINPRWFKEYGIEAVPALVVNDGCGIENKVLGKEHKKDVWHKKDVVYGNVPIKRALSIVVERGEASNVAKSILSRGDV